MKLMRCRVKNHPRNQKEGLLVSNLSVIPFIVQYESCDQQVHLFYVANVILCRIIRNFSHGNIYHFCYDNEVADYG